MDGEDLKPRWKWWLGKKLESYANKFKPIEYCNMEHCRYYSIATYDYPQYEKAYLNILREIAMMNALNSNPVIHKAEYELKELKSSSIINHYDLSKARLAENFSRDTGLYMFNTGELTFEGLISNAKKKVIDSIAASVKSFISIDVDRCSRKPDIIVNGTLYVGIKNEKFHEGI